MVAQVASSLLLTWETQVEVRACGFGLAQCCAF